MKDRLRFTADLPIIVPPTRRLICSSLQAGRTLRLFGISRAGLALGVSALLLMLAGCIAETSNPQSPGYDENWNWDAGNGKIYVRIPLPKPSGTALRASNGFPPYSFNKDYIDYWEAVFQSTADLTKYYVASAVSGEDYLLAAVDPGAYNVLVLGGARANGKLNGERVLLASGYKPNQPVEKDKTTIIQVLMSTHTTNVVLYTGVKDSLTSPGVDKIYAYFPTVPDTPAGETRAYTYSSDMTDSSGAPLAGFMYKATFSNITGILAASSGGASALGAHLTAGLEILAYEEGIANSGAHRFTLPRYSSFPAAPPYGGPIAEADGTTNISVYAGIPRLDVPAGWFIIGCDMRYYAFCDDTSGSSAWHLRPGISLKAGTPSGGGLKVTFAPAAVSPPAFLPVFGGYAPLSAADATALGGEVRLINNLDAAGNWDGTLDEIHIFKTDGESLTFDPLFQPDAELKAQILAAAGGGSGGSGAYNKLWQGGGGAGGVIYYGPDTNPLLGINLNPSGNPAYGYTPHGSFYTLNPGVYPITVGSGGLGLGMGESGTGNLGGNSAVGSLFTALGGGGGAGNGPSRTKNGGSGGGGYGTGPFGTGTSGQGFDGGLGSNLASYSGGGGGGASGPGGTGISDNSSAVTAIDPSNNGHGGPGITLAITGESKEYAGGGAAGWNYGGGNGYSWPDTPHPSRQGLATHGGGSSGQPGAPNTGGGGSGASKPSNLTNNSGQTDGSQSFGGGSGIVVVRFRYLWY